MAKNNINNEIIIEASARIANRIGLDNLSLKLIAEELNVKSPSLYNYVSSLDSVKQNLMVYGWKQLEEALVDSAVGVTGYEALKNMCNTFYNYATNEKGVLQLCYGITSMKAKLQRMLPQDYLIQYLKY